jgi:hypothetical protein
MLAASAKRRRAMLASNPLRNSRPEGIVDDGKDVLLLLRPIAWLGRRRTGGGVPVQVYQQ